MPIQSCNAPVSQKDVRFRHKNLHTFFQVHDLLWQRGEFLDRVKLREADAAVHGETGLLADHATANTVVLMPAWSGDVALSYTQRSAHYVALFFSLDYLIRICACLFFVCTK